MRHWYEFAMTTCAQGTRQLSSVGTTVFYQGLEAQVFALLPLFT
jgi:hypothetical protein